MSLQTLVYYTDGQVIGEALMRAISDLRNSFFILYFQSLKRVVTGPKEQIPYYFIYCYYHY